MKRFIAIILIAAFTAIPYIQAFAADCPHEYTITAFDATCIERSHKLYTCGLCGDAYKIYDDSPKLPDSFYVICESEREGDTLTVTVSIGNNPGLMVSRMFVGYNAASLSVISVQVGDVWKGNSYPPNINTSKNPLVVFSEILFGHNHNNGVLFTVTFSVIDDGEDYGLEFSYNSGDFTDWDDSTNSLVKHTPEMFNIVGASELAPCDYESCVILPDCTDEGYTLHTCTVCSDSYVTDTVAPLGHDRILLETLSGPDFENTGSGIFRCRRCGLEEILDIPVLEHWEKGDLDNDGNISSKDLNLAIRVTAGALAGLQLEDSADLNGDGVVTGKDVNFLKKIITGQGL